MHWDTQTCCICARACLCADDPSRLSESNPFASPPLLFSTFSLPPALKSTHQIQRLHARHLPQCRSQLPRPSWPQCVDLLPSKWGVEGMRRRAGEICGLGRDEGQGGKQVVGIWVDAGDGHGGWRGMGDGLRMRVLGHTAMKHASARVTRSGTARAGKQNRHAAPLAPKQKHLECPSHAPGKACACLSSAPALRPVSPPPPARENSRPAHGGWCEEWEHGATKEINDPRCRRQGAAYESQDG
jgi:hypothetical protein